MSTLGDRMALIQAALQAAVPARIVTRDLKDFSLRPPADLARGVYTLISKGERDYKNYRGREGVDATHDLLIVGQLQLAADSAPSSAEDAEFELIDEIKGFVQNLPDALCTLDIRAFRQSQQIDHPYAWVSVELEYIP